MAPTGNPLSGFDLLIPFIIALAKQTGLSKTANLAIAIVIYVIWTIASLYFGIRDLPHADINQIITSFPVAFAAALTAGFAAYETVWKGLLGEESITDKTSFIKPPQEDEVVLTDDEADAADMANPDTAPPADAVG